MHDLINRQAAIDAVSEACFELIGVFGRCEDALKALPSVQLDRELIEQLRWERDTAIQRLKDLGYGLGEKPRTDDTISRQAAIDAMRKCQTYRFSATEPRMIMLADAEEVIEELPSVQPEIRYYGQFEIKDPILISEQRWIPVSERLPEEYGQYLVTFIPSGGALWTCVLIARYSDLMGIAKPSFHVGTVGKNDFMNITEQVTAWMPFPEPWRGEEHVPDE